VQAPGVVTVIDDHVNELPQLSIAVGVANTGVAGQLIKVGTGNGSITGAVISCTLMVCEAVDELPHPSVAVQVRVTLYDPAHAPLVIASTNVRLNALPHASEAVAVVNTGVAGQLIVDGAGSEAMTGAVTSCTLIVCALVDTFPHKSVAVHVRVTLYDPAHAPLVVTSAKIKLNVLPHPSDAVADANTGVAGQLIVEGAGNGAITGAVISCTLIVCEAVDAFPQPSVAVQVLVTLYEPTQAPLVVTFIKVKLRELPHASDAVAIVNDGVAGQLRVDGAGSAAMTGAVTSCTLIVCEAVEALPQPSVAVHVLVTLYEPAQAPLVVASMEVSVNALPHASEAVATANTGVDGQLIVDGAGKEAITGAVIS
jgi:hypothetical protein